MFQVRSQWNGSHLLLKSRRLKSLVLVLENYRDFILRIVELLEVLRDSAVHYPSLVASPFNLRRFHRGISTCLGNILGIFFCTELFFFRWFFITVALLKNWMVTFRLSHLLGSSRWALATGVNFNLHILASDWLISILEFFLVSSSYFERDRPLGRVF